MPTGRRAVHLARVISVRALGSAVLAALGAWSMREGLSLGLFDFGTPGPGLMPFIYGVLLTATAAIALVLDVFASPARRKEEAVSSLADGAVRRVVGYVAIGFAWTLGMVAVGFVPATVASVFALIWIVERASWRAAAITAVAATAGAHVLFVRVLGVPLPRIPF